MVYPVRSWLTLPVTFGFSGYRKPCGSVPKVIAAILLVSSRVSGRHEIQKGSLCNADQSSGQCRQRSDHVVPDRQSRKGGDLTTECGIAGKPFVQSRSCGPAAKFGGGCGIQYAEIDSEVNPPDGGCCQPPYVPAYHLRLLSTP